MDDPRPAFPGLFHDTVGRPLRERVPLRAYSNFGIGGPADYFFEARTVAEVVSALKTARRAGMRFALIGGGYNLLFDDAGFRGLVVKNVAGGLSLSGPGGQITAVSGASLPDLVELSAANGLGGFEFLAGIPGTVGGAVFGNAGAFGLAIGEHLVEGLLLKPDGGEFRATRDDFGFAYRHSLLKVDGTILLEATFLLRPGNAEKIRAEMAENLSVRAKKHPPESTLCAGSYFKNPPKQGGTPAAGYLLEQVGARDLAVGGAAVFPGHCNFLINTGNAAARDVLALAAELKKRVWERFEVRLEEEVMFLPAEAPPS